VAHDFSNLIQVILGFAEMLHAQPHQDPMVQDSIDEILTASKRASALVKQLLAIGRRRLYELEPAALRRLVEEAAGELRAALGERIRLTLAPGEDGMVRADPAALLEVLRLLCAYLRAAMPEGGAVTMAVSRVAKRREGSNAADWVCLSIEDTGSGFDPALAGRFFEPYAVKRQLRRGSGLEFAVIRALMEEHGGWITVETVPEGGSTFRLYFPRDAGHNDSTMGENT
jgi:signal transduction histidine kinase